jgi:DNA-nicking Smr family endonuclease
MARGDEPFYNPFTEAGDRLRKSLREQHQAARRERSAREEPAGSARAEKPTTAAPLPGAPHEDLDPGTDRDQAAFERAMADVRPLRTPRRVGAPRAGRPRVRPVAAEQDAEAHAQLADLVSGGGRFDIADTPEFVEGLAPGVDRRLLRRLRRGSFSVQSHLDLHGLSRAEAREEVVRFIGESRARGWRCVLLVHGRGRNSKDQVPVLKPALVSWLSRGSIGRQVLAFVTARPTDGGAGALYVLLRR